MKRILLAFASLMSISAMAQPVLTQTGLTPRHGDIFYGHFVDTLHEGAAGANVVWDLTTGIEGSLDTTFAYSCDSVSYCGTFPGSTFVEENAGDKVFFNSNTSGLYMLGISSSGMDFNATNSMKAVKFPMNYLDSYLDTFVFDLASIGYIHSQVDSYKYDGFGVLRLPSGNDTNVARIHVISHYYDSSSFGVTVGRTETYNWYKNGFGNMLATLTIDTVGATEPYVSNAAYYVGTRHPSLGITSATASISGVSVYPNPANEVIGITLGENYINSATVSIADLTGNVVYTGSFNSSEIKNGKIEINSSAFPAGMYLVKLETEKGNSIQRVVVQK